MILFQIIVVLSGIALIVWIINFSKRREREDAERREREGP
jgi:hypothetical protein